MTMRPDTDGQLRIVRFQPNDEDLTAIVAPDLLSVLEGFAKWGPNTTIWVGWLEAASHHQWLSAPLAMNPVPIRFTLACPQPLKASRNPRSRRRRRTRYDGGHQEIVVAVEMRVNLHERGKLKPSLPPLLGLHRVEPALQGGCRPAEDLNRSRDARTLLRATRFHSSRRRRFSSNARTTSERGSEPCPKRQRFCSPMGAVLASPILTKRICGTSAGSQCTTSGSWRDD